MKYKILVAEDQRDISDVVAKYLTNEGYDATIAHNGFEALEYFGKDRFHLVLLDIMMPGISGFDVLKEIRQVSDVPVIMLTAKEEEVDRLRGFDFGADDYVVKPFSPRELMRRIQVFLKRIYNGTDEIVYHYEDFALHTKSMQLYKNETEIPVTSAEYRLLYVLFKNQGQILSREQIIELAFGNEFEGYDRTIDTYIKRIRKKIEDDPKHPKVLVTKYGAGYRFGGERS